MIHHIVLFRFASTASSDQIAAASTALLAMPSQIPEIRWIKFGPNLAPGSDDYSHVLVVALDDMAAVGRYADHPHHKAVVATTIAPIREVRLAVDLEV